MFNIDQIVKALQTDQNLQRNVLTGAAGLGAGMLLSGGKFGKLAGSALKLGAVAAVGGLAYSAWQKYQQSQQGTAAGPAPAQDRFIPTTPAGEEELGRALVRAMIAGAKADGHIDGEERDRIFKRVEGMPLSAEEKAFVFDELAGPLDIEAVVRRADTPEHAAEIYAASLVAMTADTPTEKAYLDTLARRLNLEAGLVAEIHRQAQGPAPVGDIATAPPQQPQGGYVPPGNV